MRKNQIRFGDELLQRQGTSVRKATPALSLVISELTLQDPKLHDLDTVGLRLFYFTVFQGCPEVSPGSSPPLTRKHLWPFLLSLTSDRGRLKRRLLGRAGRWKVCLQLVFLEEMRRYLPRAWSRDTFPCRH